MRSWVRPSISAAIAAVDAELAEIAEIDGVQGALVARSSAACCAGADAPCCLLGNLGLVGPQIAETAEAKRLPLDKEGALAFWPFTAPASAEGAAPGGGAGMAPSSTPGWYVRHPLVAALVLLTILVIVCWRWRATASQRAWRSRRGYEKSSPKRDDDATETARATSWPEHGGGYGYGGARPRPPHFVPDDSV